MNLAIHRRGSVVALAVIVVLLSACGLPGSNAATTVKPSKTPTAKPSPSTSPTPIEESLDLSFGNSEALVDPAWGLGWTDPFVVDDGFAVLAPDDGKGSWSYTHLASSCDLHFYQGEIFDLDYTKDDRTSSDQMLAILSLGTPTPEDLAQISANAGDFALPTTPEEGVVELRIIGGSFPDGRTVVHATRMFATTGGGITVSLMCPAATDASTEFGAIADEYLGVLVSK